MPDLGRRDARPVRTLVFATLSAGFGIAALLSAGGRSAGGAAPLGGVLAALRTALDQIAKTAQAGTIGDVDAAQYAFAIIARRAGEAGALIDSAHGDPGN